MATIVNAYTLRQSDNKSRFENTLPSQLGLSQIAFTHANNLSNRITWITDAFTAESLLEFKNFGGIGT